MKKAFFLALGVFILLVGFQCFYIKQFTFKFYPGSTEPGQPNALPCELAPTSMVRTCLLVIGGLTVGLTLFSKDEKK